MTTRVELVQVRIVGPARCRFDEPITLRLVLEVFERVPQDPIEVIFTWSPVWDFPVDQNLDEMEVGPLTCLGKHEFTLQCDPPNYSDIPDPTGPTALLISLRYKGREFLHIGYNAVVTCEGDIPDVFTSADLLVRELGCCFPKQRLIEWDEERQEAAHQISDASSSSGSNSGDEDATSTDEMPITDLLKKPRIESENQIDKKGKTLSHLV